MLARMQKSLKENDEGFTLIELLVVIVIIGILAAIAIPVFLSQQKKGVDAGIKSDLKQLANLEESYYVDHTAYSNTPADFADDLKVTGDNVIDAAFDADGYCLRGSNASGTRGASGYWYYDSTEGGLSSSETAPTGACATATTFATVS